MFRQIRTTWIDRLSRAREVVSRPAYDPRRKLLEKIRFALPKHPQNMTHCVGCVARGVIGTE
jgi:hypothetical protein